MNKILRYSLVALMAMVMGNVYADEVTMKYSGSTTTNMTGENDAALVGLDASAWSVVGAKGAHDQFPGLNKNGDIRLYWKAEGGSTITVSSLNGATINSIKFTFAAPSGDTDYSKVSVTVGGNSVTGTDGTYAINSSSFVLGNGNTSSIQVRFTQLVINYTPAGGSGGGETGDAEKWDASTLDLTTAITSRENKNENLKMVPTQYPGEAPDEAQIRADATAALVLTDYIFSVETASVKLTGVSTPNSDGAPEEAWRIGSTNANQFLNTDACPVKFAGGYLQAKTGNPSMLDIEYFFTNSDGNRVGPRTVEDFWAPGCGKLPAKGEYIEVSFSKAGTFVAGLFIQRPTSNLYIIDKETIQLLAPSAIKIAGFNNNNTVKPVEDADAYQQMKLNDDYTISYANPDYSINTGKQVFGHVSFDVEAGKTYLMLNPKNQLGIYGFQFTPNEDPSGVETIKTNKVWNADAPMYNLSGQKVDKSYKGIVIQNGRKFFNK